jgi:hypothetical protein
MRTAALARDEASTSPIGVTERRTAVRLYA